MSSIVPGSWFLAERAIDLFYQQIHSGFRYRSRVFQTFLRSRNYYKNRTDPSPLPQKACHNGRDRAGASYLELPFPSRNSFPCNKTTLENPTCLGAMQKITDGNPAAS